MPILLVAAIVAAIAMLIHDAIRALWLEEAGWNYVVAAIDLAAIALFASLYRRNSKVTEWARSISLIWGLFGLGSVLLVDVSELGGRYLTAALAAEGIILLSLYFVLKLPSSKAYLQPPPPNTSVERTRGG